MKLIYNLLLCVSLFFGNSRIQAQDNVKPAPPVQDAGAALDQPMPFEKFFKNTMVVTPGNFPVYRDGAKYFIEFPETALNTDILVIGDIARGYANNIAQSSGVIRLSKGNGNNLNVTRQLYKEEVSPEFNKGMEALIQQSNLIPVSFVMPIEASGKSKGSLIVNITRQLMEGGDLFSFRDVSSLSNSDAERSGVQEVKASAGGVVFRVLRTQTVSGNNSGAIKTVDKAVAYLLDLSVQLLPIVPMQVREADKRIGFATVSYNDFGKSPYGVRNVEIITKWNLKVNPADRHRYGSGKLVEPEKPIKVFIDPTTPALFVPYIKKAIDQWNEALQSAGFKNALVWSMAEEDGWLSSGKILIKWGNAANGIVTNIITDPRTGEILAGKMNIDANISDNLLPSYFAKCGFKDPRVMENLYDPSVRGEIMEWKVAQQLGELLGMVPNLHGSAAYQTDQLRSGSWLKVHGFTSSVTDDTEFNYVVQPTDQVSATELMPRVGSYDKMAIGWAYRIFADGKAEKKALASLEVTDNEMLFLEENKNDSFTRKGDLSSNVLEASELGMKNLQLFYPQLEELTAKMKNKDEDWTTFKLLSKGFQISYQLYVDNVTSYIGGMSARPVFKNYNDISVVYNSKADQHKAMALLNEWLFMGTPAWMQNRRLNMLNTESETIKMNQSAGETLKKIINPDILNNLIKGEYALGENAYRVSDLFHDLDHYIFNDYNTTTPVSPYRMLLQTNFVYDLTSIVSKNNITSGLTDANEVLHLYFIELVAHLDELALKHNDATARERYKLMKQKITKEMNQKSS